MIKGKPVWVSAEWRMIKGKRTWIKIRDPVKDPKQLGMLPPIKSHSINYNTLNPAPEPLFKRYKIIKKNRRNNQ